MHFALDHGYGPFARGVVDQEAREVAPSVRQELQVLLSERWAEWSVYGSASPDGEETANFYKEWPDIARCLGIRLGSAKYKAIAQIWDLVQALYCTYESPKPLNCRAVKHGHNEHSN